MPELPEVESLRQRLAPHVVSRTITELTVRDAKHWYVAEGLDADSVSGLAIQDLERRAKLLLWRLSGGLSLICHLKLAGQVVYAAPGGERLLGGHPYPLPDAQLPNTSTRFTVALDDGAMVYFNDQRRFAWMRLLPNEAADTFEAKQAYGPDPLASDFTIAVLAARLAARKGRPIKAALLDQTCIAGLGNIYADESLHLAGLHPMRRAGDLSPEEVARLHAAIVAVLALAVPVGGAIVAGGKAVNDADSGRDFLRAHGRAGLICPTCLERLSRRVASEPAVPAPNGAASMESLASSAPAQIVRAVLVGRGTYFCPVCQPAPIP